MSKVISKERKEEIISYYKSKPMTIDELSEKFLICRPTVIKILNQYRIKRYTKSQLFSPNLNENYFDVIDTEEKAYFLGLIITDGCIFTTKGKSPMLAISLKNRDSYILETLKNELHSNKKITTDGRGCSELQIYSKKIVDSLRQYGITERKSLHTILPTNVAKEFHKDLIRGILDGDGSVSFYARKNRSCHIKAVRFCQGNEKFLIDLVDMLYEECGAEKINIYKEKESLWSIAYRKNESIVKIINYLYNNSSVYLTRKKNVCDLICKEIEKYGNTEITMDNKKSVVS